MIPAFLNKKYAHGLIYAVIALIIIMPLSGKQVFFLDWIPTPTLTIEHIVYGLEESVSGGLPLLFVRKGLGFILSQAFLQKAIMWLILFLAGMAMHSFIQTSSHPPRYYAGVLYMINPFVYVRFMAGHLHLLLAYALIPWAVQSLRSFLEHPSMKQGIYTCFWLTVIAVLSIHALFIVLFVYLIFFLYTLFKTKEKAQYIRYIRATALLACCFILLNAYWIIPVATADSTKVSQITQADLAASQTKSGGLNEFIYTLMMHGFWREGAYILPIKIMPFLLYFALFGVILFLTVHGFLYCPERYRVPILFMGVSAQLLAVGVGHPWFRDIFTFLFNHLYFMRGFREPQKFVALVVFAHAFFGAYGLQKLKDQVERKNIQLIVALIIIALLFAYTPTLFMSFWGQLKPVDYPSDWYELNSFLNEDTQDFKILFLPWHLYMDFSWIPNQDKRSANLAKDFFTKEVIQGDNVEVGAIYSSSQNPVSKHVESLLGNRNLTRLGGNLTLINVKYVVLTKEADYKNYFFLFNQTDLDLVKETEHFYVFKNKIPVHRFYEADTLTDEPFTEGMYRRNSRVRYTVQQPTKKYLIFTEAYNHHWKLNGQDPMQLGPVNAYVVEPSQNSYTLTYTRFTTYLVSYSISLVVLVIMGWQWWRKKNDTSL